MLKNCFISSFNEFEFHENIDGILGLGLPSLKHEFYQKHGVNVIANMTR